MYNLKKTQAQEIADINLMALKKQIPIWKAMELIFLIRNKYEKIL